jgi:hypothetical protein
MIPQAAVDGNRERALRGKSRHSASPTGAGHSRILGQYISPLFRAADRSRPNLGSRFNFGVETFGKRANRKPSIG